MNIKQLLLLLTIISLGACQSDNVNIKSSMNPVNWEKRFTTTRPDSSFTEGISYLSVYAQVFNKTEHSKHDLTATISLRNINLKDTIYIQSADYYNTEGNKIRTYFSNAIFIAPLETLEIVIDESDMAGGTGGNFLFNWYTPNNTVEPIFEAVMVNAFGQQAFAYTSTAHRVK